MHSSPVVSDLQSELQLSTNCHRTRPSVTHTRRGDQSAAARADLVAAGRTVRWRRTVQVARERLVQKTLLVHHTDRAVGGDQDSVRTGETTRTSVRTGDIQHGPVSGQGRHNTGQCQDSKSNRNTAQGQTVVHQSTYLMRGRVEHIQLDKRHAVTAMH